MNNNDPQLELSNLAVLMRHRPDGLLLVPAGAGTPHLRRLVRQSTIPIVTFDRPLPGCSSVLTDNYQAAFEATQHLIAHGRERILCLAGESELFTIAERIRGYRDAMQQAGLSATVDSTFSGDARSAEGSLRAHLAGKHPPDAVFTLKNSGTVATYQAFQRLRVAIPSRVALIGFDDFDLAGTLRPAITVVQQPIEEVGRSAAELLFVELANIASGGATRPRRYPRLLLESRLVLRRSCGCTGPQDPG